MGNLAAKVRAKFPGVYDDMDDAALESAVRAKYPGVYDDMASPSPTPQPTPDPVRNGLPWTANPGGGPIGGLVKGAAKGAGSTLLNIGEFIRNRFTDAPAPEYDAIRADYLTPEGTAEKIGFGGEQIAEFFAPGGAAVKGSKLLQAIKAALTAKAQGSSNTGALVSGATAGVPVESALSKVGGLAERMGKKFVRSSLKPARTDAANVAGASTKGTNAIADHQIDTIVKERFSHPDKAQAIIDEMEGVIKGKAGAQPVDGPTRMRDYLLKEESRVAKEGTLADPAKVRARIEKVLKGTAGEDLITMVPGKAPAGFGVTPPMVPKVQRVPRTDMTASEALEMARAKGEKIGRKGYGGRKALPVELLKTEQRGLRDSIKEAIPELRPTFTRQGDAIEAKRVLDRAFFREANNDSAGLGALVMAAPSLAVGKVPVMGIAAALWKANRLRAGGAIARLGMAAAKGDANAYARIAATLTAAELAQLNKAAEEK